MKLSPHRCSPLTKTLFVLLLALSLTPDTRLQAGDPVPLAIPASDDGLPGTGPIRRYDWFRQLWLERRSAWAERAHLDRHAVVFLGDSITQMWGDDLGGAFPGLKIANRGISGDTTRGVLIRLQQDVLDLQPAAVILLIGTNDLEERAEPEVAAANLKLILDRLEQQNASMPVVLCAVFPSSAEKSRPADKIRRLNELYRRQVQGDPRVTLLDTWTLFANSQGDAKPEEFPDLLHPNATGYGKWAAALRPVLATLGFIETADDSFELEPGFQSLFNGRDLSGWEYPPTSAADIEAARSWQASDPNAAAWPVVAQTITFPGLSETPDGRFRVLHGRLVVTTPPEGRKIQRLSTTRTFTNNFTLRLEFRATPNADSGVFIREPQLQCRDYPLAGPYKALKNYRPQDWNVMEVVVSHGIARCTCNGELLEEALAVPPSGPIGLEGDRGQMEYRRIRIRELPTHSP